MSGVADPAVASAWATVAPFEPSGVVVLAAADSVREMAQDRYVGGEVIRQLVGADLILLTKSDLCEPDVVRAVEDWLDDVTGGVARLSVVDGIVPASVVLGVEPSLGADRARPLRSPAHRRLHDVGLVDRAPGDTTRTRSVPRRPFPTACSGSRGSSRSTTGHASGCNESATASTLRAEVGSDQPGTSESPSALVAVGLVDLVTHETLTRLATTHLT